MADNVQYVTLGIAKEIFAVPVVRVQEILGLGPISRLPHAPPYLLGMIDVRGQGVPVIDLRTKLGFAQSEDTHDTRIVVLTVTVNGRDLILGLKSDRVFEVTGLDGDHLDAPPEIGVRWRSEAIQGVGRRNGAFVTVLDLTRMFMIEDVSRIAAGPSLEADHAA